jgi:hypothetical protein
MGFVFFPLVGRGLFAVELGLGIAPAVLMLFSLLIYAVTMSFVYNFLNRYYQTESVAPAHTKQTLAAICSAPTHVRFTPESGHS